MPSSVPHLFARPPSYKPLSWPPISTRGLLSTLPLSHTTLYTITTLATNCLLALQSLPSLASIPWEQHAPGPLPSISLLSATRHTFWPLSPLRSPLRLLGSGTLAPNSSCATPVLAPAALAIPLQCPCHAAAQGSVRLARADLLAASVVLAPVRSWAQRAKEDT